VYSISAPIHYVDGIPISNNTGNLKLGDSSNAVVECLELQSGTSVTCPLGEFDLVQTEEITPSSGLGGVILVDGILNLQEYAINNLKNLTLSGGATGSTNQVLSIDSSGDLIWKNDATNDVSQWATFPAVQNVDVGGFSIGQVDELSSTSVSTATLNVGVIQNVVGISSGQAQGVPFLNDINMDLNNINNVNLLRCESLKCTYNLEYVYYVSPNGDDTNTGNIMNPFQTINQAVSVCDSLTAVDNINRYVIVQAGNYSENVTITKKINLIGLGTSPYSSNVGCQINGVVTVDIDTNGGDMFNNACNISGFLLNQIIFESAQNSILNLNNVYIYSPNDTSGRGLYFNPSSANSRLRITNCQIVSGGNTGTDPLIEITSVSSVTINNCIFSAKGLQNVLKFSGTATCDTINTCKIENSNSGANVPALVEISATVSGTYTFSNCGFVYSSTTSKSGNSSASGILSSSASGNNQIVVLYSSFFLFGTSSSLNYAVQDANFGTAQSMIVIYYMNNASLQNAFAIHAVLNVNKFQLQIMS
jgi:hypothetical protein